MPNRRDIVVLNVNADRVPTISGTSNIVDFERRTATATFSINTGRPVSNSLTISFHTSASDARNDRNRITSGSKPSNVTAENINFFTDGLAQSNTNYTVRVTMTLPSVSGESSLTVYMRTQVDGGYQSAYHVTTIRINQDIAASISIASSFTHFEDTAITLPFNVYLGSPTAHEVVHSWHGSASDASSGSNPITINRPPVTISVSYNAPPFSKSGTLSLRTPAVTSVQTYYGRVVLRQRNANGVVVEWTDTYQLRIENNLVPSMTIPDMTGIEGVSISIPYTQISGTPYATHYSITWHGSLSDAYSGSNRLTSGIPTHVTFSPATPRQAAGTHTGILSMTLPLVSSDRRIYARVRIWTINTAQIAYFSVLVLDRKVATINFQRSVDIDERGMMTITGTYTRGVPAATQITATPYANESDARARRNPLTSGTRPTIVMNPTVPDASGSPTAQKTVTMMLTAPEVSMDEDFGIDVRILQEEFTDVD